MSLIVAIACAVISGGAGLLMLGGAMTYEEKRRKADLHWTLVLLVLALMLAFVSGWFARGVG